MNVGQLSSPVILAKMRKKETEIAFKLGILESWKTMYRNKTDMLLWLLFNVVLGAIPVWFVFLVFSMSSPTAPSSPETNATAAAINVYDPFLKGDFLIFITSLCAASISIIWEIRDEHYWNLRRMLVAALVLLIFVSSSLYSLLSFPTVKSVMNFNDLYVIRGSLLIGFVAIVICFHMFAMRFSMNNVEDFAKEESEKRANFIQKTKGQTESKSGEKV